MLKTSNSCYDTIIRWTEVDVDKRRELYIDVVRIRKSASYIFRNNLGRNISISMIGNSLRQLEVTIMPSFFGKMMALLLLQVIAMQTLQSR